MVSPADFDPEAFAARLRRTCGFGRYACFGAEPKAMVGAMRRSLLDAFDAKQAGSVRDVLAAVLDLRGDGPAALDAGMQQLEPLGARYLVVVCSFDGEDARALRMRDELERSAIKRGYRKSPAYYEFNPYSALNHAQGFHVAQFERVPSRALVEMNLEVLDSERLLHTDMLREVGRRSDAHCVRYHFAAEYIRPGDRVLDVACGLGYGSHIMFSNSGARSVHGVDLSEFGIEYAKTHYGQPGRVEFTVGNAEGLGGIPDGSIDFIAGFETIEHVPHPEKYLAELNRVLAPGGRVMVCAPNDWTDETGRDPNPHHLHVYTWEKLRSEMQGHFLLEKAFVQVAGGAMKCHFSPRSWSEVDLDRPDFNEAEWIVFLGMKDPLDTKGSEFEETSCSIPSSRRFNVSAFARDYANPWLVKSMVAIGMRLNNAGLLDSLRRRVWSASEGDSVDRGAALCGILYGLLQNDRLGELGEWRSPVERYIGIRKPAPHQRRWQVSIAYAYGLASFVRGDAGDAMRFLEAASNIDPVPYSPLLGTKTLDALFLQAVLKIGEGDGDGARVLLRKSVALTRAWTSGGLKNAWHATWLNIAGREDAPHPSGLAEMGILFDKASRAAYMLAVLDSAATRPGAVGREAEGFVERQISGLLREVGSIKARERQLVEEIRVLGGDFREVERHVRHLGAELDEKRARVKCLAAEVVAQDGHAQRLAGELTRLQAEFAALCERSAADIAQRDARISELAKEIQALLENESRLAGEVVRNDQAAQRLAREVREIDAHSQATAKRLLMEIEARDRLISQLKGDAEDGPK